MQGIQKLNKVLVYHYVHKLMQSVIAKSNNNVVYHSFNIILKPRLSFILKEYTTAEQDICFTFAYLKNFDLKIEHIFI